MFCMRPQSGDMANKKQVIFCGIGAQGVSAILDRNSLPDSSGSSLEHLSPIPLQNGPEQKQSPISKIHSPTSSFPSKPLPTGSSYHLPTHLTVGSSSATIQISHSSIHSSDSQTSGGANETPTVHTELTTLRLGTDFDLIISTILATTNSGSIFSTSSASFSGGTGLMETPSIPAKPPAYSKSSYTTISKSTITSEPLGSPSQT